MEYDFVVLGATGMQGRIVSRDLLERGYSVLLCGRDKERVEPILRGYKKTAFEHVDVRDKSVVFNAIKDSGANIVINCVEGDWNINVLEICLKAKVNSLDLGSDMKMTKDQLSLSSKLKKKNLTHITGCGSVPGIGNVMLNYAANKFDKIKDVEVGFAWDSNIKEFVVPFSIQSIIEEFTAYAPFVSHKKIVKVKPMDTLVTCYHRAIGREKQFNVGHHPETYTFYEFCKNKGVETVKFFAGFPDHSFEKIMTMVELGFGEKDPVNIDGKDIIPIEFLTRALKKLKMPERYMETENLWVDVSNKDRRILMECVVPTLEGWEDAGCNIDTGMPASIIAQMIKNGVIKERGSFAPEALVPPEPFFKELRKRKMIIYENGRVIN